MLDRIILAPYFIALKIRHFLYDKSIRKSVSAEVPTICIGNITVGGTGKTPHTEMVIRLLQSTPGLKEKKIAVLSRGYKRKSKGFQQVMAGTDADFAGDEPLQIKNKFPEITVAVDADRVEGCDFLCHPEKLESSKKGKKCLNKDFPAPDVIILDDAFQHRALKPALSILLIDWNRPVHKDSLIPIGRLRDLKERTLAADIIIVSKCPSYIEEEEMHKWLKSLGIKDFDEKSREGVNKSGKRQTVLFSTIGYDTPEPVFPEGDTRYVYAQRAVAFTGIANDRPFLKHLKGTYMLMGHIGFGDHHKFTASDIAAIKKSSDANPTAIVMTTEKDSQRVIGLKNIPESLKQRMFRVPIKVSFLSEEESEAFLNRLKSVI